jgi:hypothetical protein|tara:strand:- start:5774 stop:5971 length:198 start_codon:yes stop_codon:yes gene_type:complete
MFKIKEKIVNIWKALTYPSGMDKAYDKRCDDAFDKLLDKITTFSWIVFSIFASISIYLLITREVL